MTIRQSPTSATLAAVHNSRSVGLPRPRPDGNMVLWALGNSGFFDGEDKVKFYMPDYQGNNIAVIDANGDVVEQMGYYPYGMPWSVPESTPYLFADKEYQHLSGLDEYIHGARRSVPYACAFSTPDALCEERPHHSPYLFCGGNPIRNVDPSGNKFTEESLNTINIFISQTEALLKDSWESILNTLNQMLSGNCDSPSKATKSLMKQANIFNECTSALEEIQELASSFTYYHVDVNANVTGATKDLDRGCVEYNKELKRIDIKLSSFSMPLLAHELKHAYQFEIGALSLGKETKGLPFYDLHDEKEAYRRQQAYGGEGNYIDNYSFLQEGPSQFNDGTPRSELWKWAAKYKAIFKVKGLIYNGTNISE